ncbi:MAG: hypothetical protein A2504_16860 [Bdellovibrionales bacterium RIFOXYD12_FULL_39_22]|nr:MAG: hypothetical protein A2385_12795 [Bdellovibrionales bacterium RIFOXYB1_FULL_39_21]OFZ42471.1 MAG: hypothetical protein A2485_04120 [Bdellovibrionales bacterium RIFOXYC12_FULL_39_17]OFZ45779.1 MAG: hypothetical protein A2404_17555 [Bdellovibrionales bacterium RIFOXYC1_FULL_39_130]OFZ74676.1 MAG: hypothetical protein A2560_08365 [Bdellovibrionales bacterium RIFOXYD1_FULL_39_84]OFZ94362.1 MAG: hypothetical protein A2504_16860 [Bdellovibrionales bacterium RIFOXYD12_FULL_39_22]HLE11350.1 si
MKGIDIDSNINSKQEKVQPCKSALCRPWLDQKGKPIGNDKLKIISKDWDQSMWEKYLSWYETPSKEILIHHRTYDALAEQMEESVFALSASGADDELKVFVRKLVSKLTPKQQRVIHMIYWDGKSEREIATELNLSRIAISKLKKRAFRKITMLWPKKG